MIELTEKQSISGPPQNAGTIGLSRRGGVPKLYIKSPLLENYFRTVSKGETLPRPDKVFGVQLYKVQMDARISQEFLRETGAVLVGGEDFYGLDGDGKLFFNLSFLRAVGAGQGISFPLHTMLPQNLIENGSFARAVRLGVSKLLKEFIVDFETEISFQYTSRVE